MIVSWNTTNSCNMYCDHCYRDSGPRADEELTTREAENLIDEIAKAGFKIMIFSGGEPLMREDIFHLINYAKNRNLRPVMGTNGTLINTDVAKQLKSSGVMGVGISLDSIDPTRHDQLRRYPNAWQEAIDGMNNCRLVNLPFQIHTTVMGWNNNELESITDLAVELGAVAHHFFFLVPTGRAVNIEEESLRAEEYEQVITRILEKQKRVNIELKPTCAPQFMRIAQQMGLNLRYGRGCLAGTSYCIISPVGQVQPCAYLNIELGNVRETAFSEIWKNNSTLNHLRSQEYSGGCGSCAYKKSCGGCRARAAYYNSGDYMAEEPWCLYQNRREFQGNGFNKYKTS